MQEASIPELFCSSAYSLHRVAKALESKKGGKRRGRPPPGGGFVAKHPDAILVFRAWMPRKPVFKPMPRVHRAITISNECQTLFFLKGVLVGSKILNVETGVGVGLSAGATN